MRLVVAPALNERDALPTFARQMRVLLDSGLVDQVVIADGGSTDGTPDQATALGFRVVRTDLLTAGRPVLGKGDNVRRAVAAQRLADDDTVVLLDTDVVLTEVERLGELIQRLTPEVSLVKADFTRLTPDGAPSELRGGRVTEFVARPLLAQIDQHLASLGQPLSGQVAVRFGAISRWPLYSHYALEIGMLIEASRQGAVIEVNIGSLRNSQRPEGHLSNVATDVVDGFFAAGLGHLRAGSRVQRLEAD